jgi:NAD(P)-dependent dehydrogenase (short-subunit alcohol dehydrogenase family)
MRSENPHLAHLGRPVAVQGVRALILTAAGAALFAAARKLRRRPPIDFRDRVALITGGSRGLGLLLARELALQGARLAILARDPDELDIARRELAAVGHHRVLALPCDVRQREDAEWTVAATIERFGRLDILINNAGVVQVGPLEHMELEDFEDALKVHFWGPLYFIRAALPHLRQREGRIVNISSIGGKIAIPHMAPYCASKHALTGLSNCLRTELAKDRVWVTTVCPGLMRTGSHVNALFKGKRREELAWFAVTDALPITSMSGRRAARRILEACRHGEPHLILTPQARLAAAAATLAPGLAARALEVVNRLLPGPAEDGDGQEARPGWQHTSDWVPSLLTRLADEAAVENNELRGRAYGRSRG